MEFEVFIPLNSNMSDYQELCWTLFAFKVVGAHLLSRGGGRCKHAVVEARQTTLFALKAVGAHLLSEGQKS